MIGQVEGGCWIKSGMTNGVRPFPPSPRVARAAANHIAMCFPQPRKATLNRKASDDRRRQQRPQHPHHAHRRRQDLRLLLPRESRRPARRHLPPALLDEGPARESAPLRGRQDRHPRRHPGARRLAEGAVVDQGDPVPAGARADAGFHRGPRRRRPRRDARRHGQARRQRRRRSTRRCRSISSSTTA